MEGLEHVDVLIVGSGPSGISTALHLVRRDPSWAGRVVVVDKAVHPRDKLCGGGITFMGLNILTDLGLPLEPQSFVVRETRLVYGERSYSLVGNPVFRIIRRSEFDHWLVRTAEKLGVRVRQGEAVVEITPHDEYIEVVTDKATFRAAVVVAADGSRSIVRRKLKWSDPPGVDAETRVARLVEVLTPEDPQTQPEFRDGVAVFDFTPMKNDLQGYYWDFPSFVAGRPFMNRGVFDSRAVPQGAKADLKQTLRESMAARGRAMDDYELKGHPIRWWHPDARFARPRVILVGDAAGADPLFGEGISFALGYGVVAAAAIDDAFARRDFSFERYPQMLREDSLFKQLDLRTRLAKLAYRLMKYPWLVDLGWRLGPLGVRLFGWHKPERDPTRPLEAVWSEVAAAD